MNVRTGLDRWREEGFRALMGKRFGVLVHAASVDQHLDHLLLLLQRHQRTPVRVFSPEHGLFGEVQDMVPVEEARDPLTGLPLRSLYGPTPESLRPRPEDLEDLDLVVVDLQDVGSRYYTYFYTLKYLLEEAARVGTKVVVLDRPNPLGGVAVEGNRVQERVRSFVGDAPLPNRHGLTIGEFARWITNQESIPVDLEVVPMEGWRREMHWPDTGLPWVPPSPNMPLYETALVYPGMCLLEGTNLSEGRGTTRPFETFGAPFLRPLELIKALQDRDLPGVRFRPIFYVPTFQKWAGERCGGLVLHVTDREAFRPLWTGLVLLRVIHDHAPEAFAWRTATYEYQARPLAIERLLGAPGLHEKLLTGDLATLYADMQAEAEAFDRERQPFLLYA